MKTHWFIATCAAIGVGSISVAIISLPHVPFVKHVEVVTQVAAIPTSVKMLFVGDIMFDRNVAVHAREVGWEKLFAGVSSLFESNDLLIGNLEGAITTNNSIAEVDHTILHFTFATSTASLLARVGFDAVSLANNHALDFGKDGYNQTIQFLSEAGIAAFGSPYNDLHLATQVTVHDKNVCLVGYHSLYEPDTTSVIEKIKTIRLTCDHLIVMAHWGVEYQHEPIAQQREAAHAFVDAGADVVIGAHPHVVEPMEIYNKHAIFYSLGNFLFDQGFRPEVKRGVAVEIAFEASSTIFILTPITTFEESGLATGAVAEAVMDDVVNPYLAPEIAAEIKEARAFELRK